MTTSGPGRVWIRTVTASWSSIDECRSIEDGYRMLNVLADRLSSGAVATLFADGEVIGIVSIYEPSSSGEGRVQ